MYRGLIIIIIIMIIIIMCELKTRTKSSMLESEARAVGKSPDGAC